MITFAPKITVPHGRLLSAKNASRITVPYFCQYVIRKEREGFIFREVGNGSGISGHSPTVRELVINAARFNYLVVEFDAEKGGAK